MKKLTSLLNLNREQSTLSRAREPRTTWLIIGLAVIGLVGANALWLVPGLEIARENAARLRLEIAGRAADSVVSFIESKISALANSAAVLRFNQDSSLEILNRLLKEHAELSSVSLVDHALIERVRLGRLELPEEGMLRTAEELRQFAQKGTDSFFLGPVRRGPNLEPLVAIAVPVEFPDRGRGFLLAQLNLKFLSERVSRLRFGETGKVYIIDEEGALIIDPNLSLVFKHPTLTDRPIVQAILGGTPTVFTLTHRNEQGRAVAASGIFLSRFHWGVISEQDLTETNALRNRILLLATISLAIGFILIAALVMNSRRLVEANQHLREILHENYESAKMLVRRDRELVAVNSSLRELLQDLENAGKMLVRRDLDLTRANARLEELDAIKSEFVSIAAHQLRTPLTGIRWSYQTILDSEVGELVPEQRRLLESGLGATLRMVDLVNDLLNVARIEEGKFGIRLKKQSIVPVLERLVVRYAAHAKEKAVAFSFEMSRNPPLPDLVFDEEKIGIVFDNLLDNAVHYTEPGGSVSLRVSRKGERVEFEIADTGIGISKDQLPRVFTKFFRADNALRLHTAGTGLGLYVVKNVVEKHDGTVEVESREGEGSIFRVTLPVA